MPDLNILIQANAARWRNARLTRAAALAAAARRLVTAKARYQAIAARTGVPWFVIAVIHEREAAQDFSASIAQGDPWNRISIHVPKGRGPFASFEEAACDALIGCAPHAASWRDWSSGGSLTLLEQYNGLGYFNRGLPSPYVWAGTDQYVKGKYIRDGLFDGEAVDRQLGCAGLLRAMMQIDQTIAFAGGVSIAPPAKPPPDSRLSRTPPVSPPQRSALAAFLSLVTRLFKRR